MAKKVPLYAYYCTSRISNPPFLTILVLSVLKRSTDPSLMLWRRHDLSAISNLELDGFSLPCMGAYYDCIKNYFIIFDGVATDTSDICGYNAVLPSRTQNLKHHKKGAAQTSLHRASSRPSD